MEKAQDKSYEAALLDIRTKLAMRRGYGSRIAQKLGVKLNEIYAVAWGKKKDPDILEALVNEAIDHQTDRNQEIITRYLQAVA